MPHLTCSVKQEVNWIYNLFPKAQQVSCVGCQNKLYFGQWRYKTKVILSMQFDCSKKTSAGYTLVVYILLCHCSDLPFPLVWAVPFSNIISISLFMYVISHCWRWDAISVSFHPLYTSVVIHITKYILKDNENILSD